MMIQYKYPFVYKLFIPITHRKSVLSTFKNEVGKNVDIFDVAAGFGQMSKYIDVTNTYYGIDLNKKYVRYANKRGRCIVLGDIFDKKAYVGKDVFILVDVIHHLPPQKLSQLFDLVFEHAKKRVVILEPAFLNLGSKYGVFGSIMDWMFKKLDNDGVNKIEHWMSEKEYEKLFQKRFGSSRGDEFRVKVLKKYPYFVVTYSKS